MHTVLLLAVLAIGGVDIYRWVDSSGQVHYSDRARPGAEKIVIEGAPASGTSIAAPGRSAGAGASDADTDSTGTYRSVTIRSPGQDQVLWNIEGQLEVDVAVQPGLRPAHVIQLYLDGRRVATLDPGSTATRLSEVYRGEHTLRAEVLDGTGTSLILGPIVKFTVRQTSIANPQNPVTRPTP